MRKFLASVGNAKLLGKKNNQVYHIADVRTLTESTLSFSNTQEEVRAGEGAQLYGRFSHDSGLAVTLTDAMFDLNYIALQTGAIIDNNPKAFNKTTSVSVDSSDETIDVAGAQPMGNACGLNYKLAWAKISGCGSSSADNDWLAIPVSSSSDVIPSHGTAPTASGSKAYDFRGKNICLQYIITKSEANALKIPANFIPAELILILTTKLFAGDANAPETGKPVGEITVKIPRFSLDGTFDLSMAMSSAATISLAGTALATEDDGCDGSGIYAEIVEVKTDSTVADGLVDIIVDEETIKANTEPGVYGKYADGHISQLVYDPTGENGYKTAPALTNGKFGSSGTYTFSVDGDNTPTESVTISA